VLNTSLLESGKIYLQQESCNMALLVQEVIGAMQPRFAKNNTSVKFETNGNDFCVPADKLHIQGVLVNLLDNSMKYGQGKINILIRLKEAAGKVQLSFADNGPGIPEEYRDKIFEKFFRVPNADRHDTKGHGLGLSYAAQVMRQHNGSINVRNIAQGGCEFTLTF
jgi:signal transduction histidine kinase